MSMLNLIQHLKDQKATKIVHYSDGDEIEFFNENNFSVYYEDENSFWEKREYDSNGNETYYETSKGFWIKREYDSKGNITYTERSQGFWEKNEYDSNSMQTYFENSRGEKSGTSKDEVKELTVAQLEELLGCKVKVVK